MKNSALFILIGFLFFGCEKPSDCIKSSGPTQSKIYEGISFTKLLVNKRIGVVIKQGDTYKVEVKAGENLINDIEVTFSGDLLTLTDNTSCNWVRDYGQTVVCITAPNLTDIFSKTEQNISSDGILTFPNLRLVSMDYLDGYPGVGLGDFIMHIENESITAENNEVGRFFLTGTTNNLAVSFYEYGGIFHGEDLLANSVLIYHRGNNDMFVRPVNAIRGDLYNVGNIYCYSRPPIVAVIQHYRGKLIFQ